MIFEKTKNLWRIVFAFSNSKNSPGALAQKSCQPEKKCRKLKFSGKLLGCPLNTTVKSPQKSQRRKIVYSRWPPSPLVAYCYTINHVNFLIFVIERQFWGAYPSFERQKTQWNHYSNISLNPAGENPIWRPLQSEFYQRHQNVIQLVYQEDWVPMKTLQNIFQNDF